jgi:MHS family proline/betaine transporter-like MFS transporter
MNDTPHLTREQKEAVGLLSIGTFLEYFDLMLYVHMAVLLNELFFPKTDPHTASLLSAFAFCSTYLLRPLGGLIFGYIGDNIGRKHTVIITTFMMSLSCIIMANLPTYEQIGISAAWIVTGCRIAQGMSSMGEITGAKLYLTEITKPPIRYPVVAVISIASILGGVAALAVASLSSRDGFSWRMAFGFGAIIAVIGGIARTRLRETPDFADAKRRLIKIVERSEEDPKNLEANPIWQTKVDGKLSIAYFFIHCIWPVCFYFAYVYCGTILKTKFGFSSNEVIKQNFIVSMFHLSSLVVFAYLTYKVYPLKIFKNMIWIFCSLTILSQYLLYSTQSPYHILLVQIFATSFAPGAFLTAPIFYTNFPVFKRFTYSSLLYAVSHSMIYIICSFGLVYLTKYFGNAGILLIITPIIIGSIWGVLYLEAADKRTSNMR